MSFEISPREKGLLNAENYSKYVDDLERDGKKFPVNQYGKVNKDAVAAACGFNRQVFNSRRNKIMADRLASDVARLGTMGIPSDLLDDLECLDGEPTQEDEKTLAKMLKKAKENLGKAKKDLALAYSKITALEGQVDALEDENAILKTTSKEQRASFDHMVSTGRRFTL